MAEILGVCPEEIWTVFEHVMTDHFHLFHDRHIDQIMLSSTYLISKANGRGITFSKIIESYRQLPHVQDKQDVYRNVPLRTSPLPQMLMCSCKSTINKETSDIGDIIEFYNTVFLSHKNEAISDYVFGSLVPLLSSYLSSPGKYYQSEGLVDKTSFIDPYFFEEIPGNKPVEKHTTESSIDHDFPTKAKGPEKSAETGISQGPGIGPGPGLSQDWDRDLS